MARIGDGGDLLKCNFCGKSQKQVKKLIAGPNVYICDECIELCNDIIAEEWEEEKSKELRGLPKPAEIKRFPAASVWTSCSDPNQVWPSPNPEASQTVL